MITFGRRVSTSACTIPRVVVSFAAVDEVVSVAAKPALPHLDESLAPSQHADIWSYDNIPDMIALVRTCADENASAKLKRTRQTHVP